MDSQKATFPYKPKDQVIHDSTIVELILSRRVVGNNVAYLCKMSDGVTKYIPAEVFNN